MNTFPADSRGGYGATLGHDPAYRSVKRIRDIEVHAGRKAGGVVDH